MVALSGTGWRLAPSLVALVAECDELAPNRSIASDGSIGDAAHSARTSDHNPADGWVCAVDITDDKANGLDADLLARHIVASRDPRVKYVIWNGTIAQSAKGWVPETYTGSNSHFQHTHVSIHNTTAARDDLSPWWPTPEPQPAPQPKEENDLVYRLAWLKKPDKPGVLYRVLFAKGKDDELVPVEAYDVPSEPKTVERWRGRLEEIPPEKPIPANTFIRIMDGPYKNVS